MLNVNGVSSVYARVPNYTPDQVATVDPKAQPAKSETISFKGEEEPEREKSGLSVVSKVIIGAAVLLGGAVAARKLIPALNEIDPSKVLGEDAKLTEKIGHYFAKATDSIVNFFKFSPKKVEDDVTNSAQTIINA